SSPQPRPPLQVQRSDSRPVSPPPPELPWASSPSTTEAPPCSALPTSTHLVRQRSRYPSSLLDPTPSQLYFATPLTTPPVRRQSPRPSSRPPAPSPLLPRNLCLQLATLASPRTSSLSIRSASSPERSRSPAPTFLLEPPALS